MGECLPYCNLANVVYQQLHFSFSLINEKEIHLFLLRVFLVTSEAEHPPPIYLLAIYSSSPMN